MYLIGDIGNTEVKLCLFDKKDKLIKKTVLKSNLITKKFLLKKLFFLRSKTHLIKTSVFSSVVPKIYKIINSFLTNIININCIELKEINLNKIINYSTTNILDEVGINVSKKIIIKNIINEFKYN